MLRLLLVKPKPERAGAYFVVATGEVVAFNDVCCKIADQPLKRRNLTPAALSLALQVSCTTLLVSCAGTWGTETGRHFRDPISRALYGLGRIQ